MTPDPITFLHEHLAAGREQLVAAGIEPASAAIDVDLFARTILGWDRARVLTARSEPAPAALMGRLRVAVEPSGAQMNADPMPSTAGGMRSQPNEMSGVSMSAHSTIASAPIARPGTATTRGWTRSVMRPAMGARTSVASAVGTVMSAD